MESMTHMTTNIDRTDYKGNTYKIVSGYRRFEHTDGDGKAVYRTWRVFEVTTKSGKTKSFSVETFQPGAVSFPAEPFRSMKAVRTMMSGISGAVLIG